MNLDFLAQERPVRNVPTAEFNRAKIMPSRVEHAARSSARPAVSYIERSIRNLYMGNVESERELKA